VNAQLINKSMKNLQKIIHITIQNRLLGPLGSLLETISKKQQKKLFFTLVAGGRISEKFGQLGPMLGAKILHFCIQKFQETLREAPGAIFLDVEKRV